MSGQECQGADRATRITLVIAGMGPGGAERVLSLMAAYWSSQHDRRVIVVTLSPPFADFFSCPPPSRA